MRYDDEGHVVVTPREVEQLLTERTFLINEVLIPGTPVIFGTRRRFFDFRQWLSDELRLHPRNLVVRGSTKLGFSLHPDKLWSSIGPASDVDLAVVDGDYYHLIDRAVRHFELAASDAERVECHDTDIKKSGRTTQRSFYCYRFFDLPELSEIQELQSALKRVPSVLLDLPRRLNVFIFRDWWSIFERWMHELGALDSRLAKGELPHAPEHLQPAGKRITRDE